MDHRLLHFFNHVTYTTSVGIPVHSQALEVDPHPLWYILTIIVIRCQWNQPGVNVQCKQTMTMIYVVGLYEWYPEYTC